jgi:predicted O-methyltransferase YrrM
MANIIARPEAYFRTLLPERDRLLQRLENEAARESIPIVGPAVGELLYILACACGARRILELGTATGYSAVYLARACRETDGHLTTLEADPAMVRRAEQNLRQAGLAEVAEVRMGNALDIMPAMAPGLDFIFMDIDKEGYPPALPGCHRLLKPGGLLVVDNVAFEDAKAFNRLLAENDGWRSISLFAFLPGHSPEHDGLGVAVRC